MNRAAPAPLDNMGRPEPRLDGRAKVTGEARYGSDFIVSDVAHAFLITSPIAKGRIASIDASLAKRLPGVIEVFTYENTKGLKEVPFSTGGGKVMGSSLRAELNWPRMCQARSNLRGRRVKAPKRSAM